MTDIPTSPSPADVLTFWFDETPEATWYEPDPAFDAAIAQRFGALLAPGALDGWDGSVEARLAAIIALDQFSRNIHRGGAGCYANDARARALTTRALRLGDDLWLKAHRPEPWRAFLYMPLMHSENLEDQRRCIDLHMTHGPEKGVIYARRHHDIIARFGRFPHRNAQLGRESTPEELAFLQQDGSGF